MSRENDETLKIYDDYAKVYLETGIIHDQNDPEKAQKKRKNLNEFLKNSFSSLQPSAKIFEIGSGNGADAEFLASLGYRVHGSDVAEDFINAVKARKIDCTKFNILKDDFNDLYDGMLAWRVFVHFAPEDLEIATRKIYKALRPGGIFICNILNAAAHDGKESAWVDFEGDYHMGVERYFHYYGEEEAEKILKNAGLNIKEKHLEGSDGDKKWFIFVCEKPTVWQKIQNNVLFYVKHKNSKN